MSPLLRIRLLTGADLAFADSLRALAGWNQTLEDWRRFLTTEPEGCFLAEWNGAPAGTATTTLYGPALAWIGMVLVHPDFRRRGIGNSLLVHCIESLRQRGVRCIKLDATPLGQPVYEALGFQAEWTLRRWVGVAGREKFAAKSSKLRAWSSSDAELVAPLDTAAFGFARRRLLASLARQSSVALVLEGGGGAGKSFGMMRAGTTAQYLGPVVADSDDAGLELIEALVTGGQATNIYWDIPDPNIAAVAWAQAHGFTVQRSLTRMFLGENLAPGDPHQQFALTGPETG